MEGQSSQKLPKIPGLDGGQVFINQTASCVLCVTVDKPVLSSEILCTWEKEKKPEQLPRGFPRLFRDAQFCANTHGFSKVTI